MGISPDGYRRFLLGITLVMSGLGVLRADPPEHAEWTRTFAEEFESPRLDMTVWESQAGPRGGGKLEGRWPENNVIRDGVLHQVTRREEPPRGGKEWSTAHIMTRTFRQRYGYFEARIRYGRHLNNAFWLFRPPGARFPEPPHFEIDINEGHTPNRVNMCLHFFVNPKGMDEEVMFSRGKHWTAEQDLSGAFHVYGCEWNADEIVWYVDGKPVRRLENPNAHGPADVRLSTIILPRSLARDGVDLASMDGVSMAVDWVRVHRKVRDVGTPAYVKQLELEPCPIPRVSETSPAVPDEGTRQLRLISTFDKQKESPDTPVWIWADGQPVRIAAEDAPRSALTSGRVLELNSGDYAYIMLPEPLERRVEVQFDAWSSHRRDGLLFITLGPFDQDDPGLRASSYHTGDIGPYIHWRKAFLQYYTEKEKWQPFAYNATARWRRYRIVLDLDRRRFDMYSGENGETFIGGGPFRGTQQALHGIGFRQRGSQGNAYIDNVKILRIDPPIGNGD